MPKISRAVRETEKRIKSLEEHLRQENPLLVKAVQSFRLLDRIAYRMGLLERDHSYAMRIAWWPLVSVLGTYSAGKSTFINHFLGFLLQNTGTQAVDDKFTVICFTTEKRARTLPGVSLNADPRFPFYKISDGLEGVAPGEGRRVDAYLQLKTCPSDRLRGTILIDSPGFDADAQRTSTLRITDYIIDLSDLVLVFFDARHPEPGTMKDTLQHLVGKTITRPDSSKFLYILNQIDTTARENNPEDVVGAWHRAIAQEGLTAGKFYCIYDPEVAYQIEDESLRRRFETKRDKDLEEIHDRMRNVSLERAYRVVDVLVKTARDIEQEKAPRLAELLKRWRRSVLWRDSVIVGLMGAALIGLSLVPPPKGEASALSLIADDPRVSAVAVLLAGGAVIWLHVGARKRASSRVLSYIKERYPSSDEQEVMVRAFRKSTRPWRSIFLKRPAGWTRRAREHIQDVISDSDHLVQELNDRFTSPSG